MSNLLVNDTTLNVFSRESRADLNSWDTAAGSLLVRQAGGCVTSLEGIEYSLDTRSLLCSNARTHKSLLGVIQDAGVRGLDESDALDALVMNEVPRGSY